MRPVRFAAFLLAPALLVGCEKQLEAPRATGVCFHMVTTKDGSIKWNRVANNQPSLEYCAARLENMRRSFVALGSPRREIVGAYQGRFLFVTPRAISSARTLKGARYIALVRTGDGRLAVPGAMPRAAN